MKIPEIPNKLKLFFKKIGSWFKKFKTLPLGQKLILLFTAFCIVAPFAAVRNPGEVITHSLPIWANFYLAIGLWCYSGMSFWRTFLACYGVASFGIIGVYYGTRGIQSVLQFLWKKAKERLPILKKERKIEKFLKKFSRKKENGQTLSKKEKFFKWLSRQDLWIIILFAILPVPYSDPAAAVIMKLRNIKYGIWYILAANLVQTFIIVGGIYSGINFFF